MQVSFQLKKFNVLKRIKENNEQVHTQVHEQVHKQEPINSSYSEPQVSSSFVPQSHSLQEHIKKANFRTTLISNKINKYFQEAQTKGIKSKGGCGCGGRR